jgi:hypothetical protein
MAVEICTREAPPKVALGPDRWAACHFAGEVTEGGIRHGPA